MRLVFSTALLVFLATSVFASDIILPTGLTIQPGQQLPLTVTLAQPAPPGGVFISLSSSDTSKLTISPAAVFLSEGSIVARAVQITGVSLGAASITASASNFAGGTTVIQIGAGGGPGQGSITLPAGITLAPNQAAGFPVTLSVPAPAGGVTVSFSSSDSTKAVVSPISVSVAAGSTTPPLQPNVIGVAAGSAVIGASAPGYTSASQSVQIQAVQSGAALSFQPSSLTLSSGSAGSLQLNLSPPASAAGLAVTLSSSNSGAVTVPGSVTFPANSASASVPVTGGGPGVATITATASNTSPASATVSVNSGRDIILPSGLTVAPGAQVGIPLTLGKPAPSGGVFISLSSGDPSRLTIAPANIFIGEGLSAPSRQPQLMGVAQGSASITASASGLNGDTEVVLVGTAATLSPANLTLTGSGTTQNLSLTLSSPAAGGGLVFNVSSSNPGVAGVPASVTVLAGNTSAAIPVTGVAPGSATIHASSLPAFGDTTANVTVTGSGSIGLPAGLSVPMGQSIAFPVTLGTPAPAGGVVISLNTGDPSRAVISPGTVSVSAGATTPVAQPQVTGLGPGYVSVNASASGYTSASQTVQVIETLSFAPSSLTITGTGVQNLGLSLSAPLSSSLTVSLASSNPGVATVPANVTFGAGVTNVNVSVTGVAPGSASITASGTNVTSAVANISVTSGGVTGTISLPANVRVGPSQPAPFPLTLSVPAPAGGVTVSLSSNSAALFVTSSVFVAAGLVMPATQPQVVGVSFGTAVVTASAPGYTSASQSVQVGADLSFAPTSLTLGGLVTGNLQVNLSAPAPVGGLVVNLVSSNTGAVTVPASIPFGANSTSATVTVTGVGAGTATITATANAPTVTGATASVTVSAGGGGPDILLPSGMSLMPGGQLKFQLSLAVPAPAGGVFVTLTSGDPSKLTIFPDTVFLPQGATTARVQPQLTGVSPGLAILSAAAYGLTGASQTVWVGATLGFSPSSLTIAGIGASQNATLNIPSPAPAGGLTVFLTSANSSIATVPAILTIPANTASLNVPITAVAAGSTVIHASSPPNFPDTTLNVSVVTSGMIILPSNVTVALGQSIAFPVSIASPAPSGGLTISLTTSDIFTANITPAAIVIAQGATTPDIQPQVIGYNGGTATITASALGYGTATQTVQVGVVGATVVWHGGCWVNTTLYGYTGNYQAVYLQISAPARVVLEGSLFYTLNCDASGGGYDNMNDFGTTTGSGNIVQGFSHHPDLIPSSAIYWIGGRTADGRCPPGAPCSGCVNYTASTPNCNELP